MSNFLGRLQRRVTVIAGVSPPPCGETIQLDELVQ